MSKLSFEGIKVVALNLNGILSDGTFLLSESNEGIRVSRRFSCKDLEVFQMLKQDYMTIITSATQDCNLVAKRIIKPHHALTSVKKKFHQLKLVLNHEGFSPDEVLYAGNSIYDIECLENCKIGAVPTEALSMVRGAANVILPSKRSPIIEISEML